MSEPLWKKLVEDLRAGGHQSPYHERLRSRLSVAAPHGDLAAEVVREMASALGRAEAKIHRALGELELLGAALDAMLAEGSGASDADISAGVDAWNRKRDEAERCVWELRVHREALGFRRNDDLAQLYPVPPRRSRPR